MSLNRRKGRNSSVRSFVVVSILFIILLILVFSNAFFIQSSSEKLFKSVCDIPPVDSDICLERITAFEENWNKFKKAASLTVSYSELNRISCLIDELYAHHSNRNEFDFDHTLAIIKNSLREIPRFETLSSDSVF